MRALDATTGADLWIAPDIGELPPMGRGLLLGDLVLWPTPRGVLLVRQEDGRLAEDPGFLHSVPKGNLAFAHGCLLVADRMTLTVFVPPAQQLEERRRDAERDPDSAEAALELGLAEADAGLFDAAVKSLETAERLAKQRTCALHGKMRRRAAPRDPDDGGEVCSGSQGTNSLLPSASWLYERWPSRKRNAIATPRQPWRSGSPCSMPQGITNDTRNRCR